MASSPASSDRRANLIRELARQGDRHSSHGSASSSNGSERNRVNDFGKFFVHLSLPSTNPSRLPDTASQELPEFPSHTPDQMPKQTHEPEFQINTSALKRAFPDFSDYASTEPSEASVELGRGQGRESQRSLSPLGSDFSASMSVDIGDGKRYHVTGTPPLKPRRSRDNASKPNDAPHNTGSNRLTTEKVNQDQLKIPKKNSQRGRRTAGEPQALAESEPSLTWNDNRPAAGKPHKKNTRFGSGSIKQPLGESKSAGNVRPVQTTPQRGSANPTLQSSIAIPDIPEVTELVSGVRKDGTPIFPRGAKVLSAFGTPSSVRQTRGKANHDNVSEVPVSDLERTLYVSLQLLHDKVANLEDEKGQVVKKADEYEHEVLQLRSKLEGGQVEEKQNDGGLDLDGAEERAKDWETEKMRFEKSIKTLQKRLDVASRKVSSSENAVRNLTKDRDAAHQQLALAFVNSEELKQESQGVREDIDNVKTQLIKMTKQYEKRVEKLMNQENELWKKIERREKAVGEMSTLVKQLWETRTAMSASAPVSRTTSGRQVSSTARNISQADSQATMVNRKGQSINKSTRTTSGQSADFPRQQHQRSHCENLNRAGGHSKRQSERRDFDSVECNNSSSQVDFDGITDRDLSKDDTYGSFMEGDEVKKLQLILDNDKAKLAKYDVSIPRTRPLKADTDAFTGSQKGQIPRKSSLKDMNAQSKKNRVQYLDQEQHTQHSLRERNSGAKSSQSMRDDDPLSTEFQIDGSDNGDTRRSVTSQRSEHRRRSAPEPTENMTSALILPDITLSGEKINHSRKSEPGPDAVQFAKQTSKVKRPIPVSECPQSEFQPSDTGNFTIRPARSPAVALAMVIQGLEEEVARLREKLTSLEDLYNQQKPALSKTKRKQIYDKIQKVLTMLEHRCDQIYELYDVLEGQKASGTEMKDEEVEVTLQKAGLDLGELQNDIANKQGNVDVDGKLQEHREFRQQQGQQSGAQKNSANSATGKNGGKGTRDNTQDMNAAFWRQSQAQAQQQPITNEYDPSKGDDDFEDEGYDETEEVPWEGIEATHTQTLESLSGVIGQASKFAANAMTGAGAGR
ncbi:MAG: hypothetical protein M1831_004076 [Alyxoria varia]|nr:MAG: hypothetical protein M1831_004076 [Alyxoria varia]